MTFSAAKPAEAISAETTRRTTTINIVIALIEHHSELEASIREFSKAATQLGAAAVALSAVIAQFLPPAAPGTFYAGFRSAINALAQNRGHAKNAH